MRVAIVGFGIGGGALAVALRPARDVALPAMGAVPPLRAFMEYVLAGRG
jgi:hypothetical protein